MYFYTNLKEILENMPDFIMQRLTHFIQFFKYKHLSQEKFETALLSEFSLQKDWLTPEEDEAWQDL